MKVFKVVSRIRDYKGEDVLISMLGYVGPDDFVFTRVIGAHKRIETLEYVVGKPTRPMPGGGPIFCYQSLPAARLSSGQVCEIWLAEARLSRQQPALVASGRKDIRAFWNGENVALMEAQEGTILCDYVTLLSQVKP